MKNKMQSIAEFKVTMFIVFLWMITDIIWIFSEISFFSDISVFLLLFALATLLSEICFPKKWSKWPIICLPAGIFSGAYTYAFVLPSEAIDMFWIGSEPIYGYGIITGYVLLMLLFILFFSFQKSERTFSEYLVNVFSRTLTTSMIWLILYLGLSTIYAVINELIFDIYEWISSLFPLSVALCLIPGYLSALSVNGQKDFDKQEANVFFRFLIKYLLTGISISILGIGYLYILKIIILWQIPSNEIFSIVATLFCVGVPMWLMNEAYKEEELTSYSKLIRLLPYLFAPLIILQIWSLGLRICQYGLTTERYMGMMFILFEISFVVIWKWYRNHCERLLAIASILVFICFLCPFLNIYSLPIRNQQYFLKIYAQKLMDGEQLSDLEYNRFSGAYTYLKFQSGYEFQGGYKSLVAEYEDLMELADTSQQQKMKKRHSIHGCQIVGELDMRGFMTFNMLNQSEIYDSGSEKDIDFSHFRMFKRETGEEIEIDLSEIYKKALAYEAENPDAKKEDFTNYLKQYNRIPVDEDNVFYLNHFQISYYTIGEEITEISSVNISGMLLQYLP